MCRVIIERSPNRLKNVDEQIFAAKKVLIVIVISKLILVLYFLIVKDKKNFVLLKLSLQDLISSFCH